MSTQQYNGWKNRATWNVALWMGNDEGLYSLAKECAERCPRSPYGEFVRIMGADTRTPDGFKYGGKSLDRRALNACMREF